MYDAIIFFELYVSFHFFHLHLVIYLCHYQTFVPSYRYNGNLLNELLIRKLTRPKINLIIQVSMYRNNDVLAVNTNNTSTT
jgi:hypothetical protein